MNRGRRVPSNNLVLPPTTLCNICASLRAPNNPWSSSTFSSSSSYSQKKEVTRGKLYEGEPGNVWVEVKFWYLRQNLLIQRLEREKRKSLAFLLFLFQMHSRNPIRFAKTWTQCSRRDQCHIRSATAGHCHRVPFIRSQSFINQMWLLESINISGSSVPPPILRCWCGTGIQQLLRIRWWNGTQL